MAKIKRKKGKNLGEIRRSMLAARGQTPVLGKKNRKEKKKKTEKKERSSSFVRRTQW